MVSLLGCNKLGQRVDRAYCKQNGSPGAVLSDVTNSRLGTNNRTPPIAALIENRRANAIDVNFGIHQVVGTVFKKLGITLQGVFLLPPHPC
jgi:hypothetical protein